MSRERIVLIIVLIAASLCAAWLFGLVNRVSPRDRIAQFGGTVVGDEHVAVDAHGLFRNGSDIARAIAEIPNVYSVDLSTANVVDKDLQWLSGHDLRILRLGPSLIDGSGLELLHKSTQLRVLDLSRCQRLKPERLQCLSKFAHLKELSLDQTAADDSTLEFISRCTELEGLFLMGTKLTSRGCHHLEALQHLTVLELAGQPIDDQALESITKLPALKTLDLQGTGISDRGVESLVKCRQLTTLFLSGTAISDAALPVLADLENLQELALHETKISEAGLVELAKIKNLRVIGIDASLWESEGAERLRMARPEISNR